jgi:hypothetical protein
MDVKNHEQSEDAFTLSKLLALGSKEIEQNQFRDAKELIN